MPTRSLAPLAANGLAHALLVGAFGLPLNACSSDDSVETGGPIASAGTAGTVGMSGASGAGGAAGASGGAGRGGAGGSSGSSGGSAGTFGGGGAGGTGASGGGGSGGAGGSSGTGGGDPSRPVPFACQVTPAAAPPAAWKNVTANLAGTPSECGNLTLVAADPCSKKVIAGVAKGGLWQSEGGDWTKLGSGAGSANIVHRPSSIVFDPQHPEVFYESGIYGDGVYKTTDGGLTFTRLGMIAHNDLVSVDFRDPDRKVLLAGAHETKRKLFHSSDGGKTWTDIGMNLPDGSHFSSAPLVLDAQHFLLGACGWGDGTCGVYASSDGGKTWSSTTTEGPGGRPLWTANGHLLWSGVWDGMLISDDVGKRWKKVGGAKLAPVELPDGRAVAIGSDHLVISSDHGATWSNIGQPLPYAPNGVTYSAAAKTFYIWRNDCGDRVLSDAVMSAGFDYAM